jgi:hypothetical protein
MAALRPASSRAWHASYSARLISVAIAEQENWLEVTATEIRMEIAARSEAFTSTLSHRPSAGGASGKFYPKYKS